MKKFLALFCILLICTIVLVERHSLNFIYLNPYTNTSSFKYIGKVIKELDKAFDYAKYSANQDGLNIKYLFWNAYGSGFIKNNNIPNDLDFAIGIDLGEYKYDGKNSEEIAKSIVDKMNAFQTSFNFYINSSQNSHTDITKTPFELQELLSQEYTNNVKNIAENLSNALSDNAYVTYPRKQLENLAIDVPYIMKSHEILVENREPLMLYSDLVEYNPYMPHYKREISIIPEFFVNIDYNGKKNLIEIVPESFLGERLQLSRRFFASTVFVHCLSVPFLQEQPCIKNDEQYLFYRMLSFKRHLQEINNILVMQDRPVKLIKRLMQTADMISPVLSPEMYKEITDFTTKTLNNKDIQLLNEYANICGNVLNLMEHPKLFNRLKKDGSIEIMYKTLDWTTKALENRANIDKETIEVLKNFEEKEIKNPNRDKVLEAYEKVNEVIVASTFKQMHGTKEIEKYISIFNQIYIDAGYHKVSLYWLDNNTIGILEDEFTKCIKDFKDFAGENDLVDINYKLIKQNEVPNLSMRYDILARYNSTQEENTEFEKFKQKLLSDRKNFKIKIKPTLIIK